MKVIADSGYQGICRLHCNSEIPIKHRKKQKLSTEEKAYNKSLGRRRVIIEHINRRIKRFRILSDRYRNKRKRHGLRCALICGIHNFELVLRG